MIRMLIPLASLLCLSTAFAAAEPPPHRALLGFVEWVSLEPEGVPVKARLDTGAKTSSLHSQDTEEFERDGKDWVRFKVPLEERTLELELPIERVVLIKRKGAPPARRYVVNLPLCLDGRSYEAEFSLADRSGFNYPVLLGRRFLRDVAIVDPADSFLATRRCGAGDESPAPETAATAESPTAAPAGEGK